MRGGTTGGPFHDGGASGREARGRRGRYRRRVPRKERILLVIAVVVSLTWVGTLRDSGPKFVTSARIEPPPVPSSITDRPGQVLVLVEDETEAPVSGASVRVLSMQDDRAYLAGAARTDATGQVTVKSLPEGEAWILAEAEGWARGSTRLIVGPEAREVKMRLRRANTLRVAAVDDGGAAVPEAWVEARTGDPLPYVTRTDASGQAAIARLGPPPWNLKVRAAGFEAVSQTVNKASPDAVKVTLRKLGFVDVTTVDAEGRPVGAATVMVAGSGLWPARKTQTDAQGQAKVPDLPRGIYDFRATRGDFVSPAEMGILLGRGESKSVTLVLAQGRRVAVRVTDGEEEGSAAVGGASIVLAEGGLSSFPLEATADAHGAATLGPIVFGTAYLSARAEGFVPRTGVAVPEGPAPAVRIGLLRGGTLRGDVEVVGTGLNGEPIDETPERMAFQAAHFSWALTGPRQLVPSGELGVMPGPIPPIPHAGAMPPGLLRGSGTAPPPEPWVTRDDGTFRAFPIPPGRVRAIVRHPSYVEGVSPTVALAPGGEAHVHVVMRGGGSLEGRVIDDHGRPVSGVRVDIAASKGSLERTTMTADDGTFAFAAVPGEIVVSVSRPDALDDVALRTTVTVKEAERKEIELVLPAMREAMTVEVVDDRGTKLEGAQIRVLSLAADSPTRRTLFTDRDGHAVFKDVVGLPVQLSISHRGRAPEVREIEAAPKELRVELKGGNSVTGTVTTRRGRDRLEGAEVTLQVVTGALHARSDRDGVFRFDDVPPGSAHLLATRAGYAKAEQVVKIEPQTHSDRPAALEPLNLEEGGTVEGEVVDARGDPVVGARVGQGSIPTPLPASLPAGIVVTNAHGEFKLSDLPEGDVNLEAYAPDLGRGRVSGIRVTAGRTTSRVRISITTQERDQGVDSTSSGDVAITLDDRSAAGVTVGSITPGSEAERSTLEVGDRILRIDGQPVKSAKEARSRLSGPIGNDVVLEIARGEKRHKLVVPRERVQR